MRRIFLSFLLSTAFAQESENVQEVAVQQEVSLPILNEPLSITQPPISSFELVEKPSKNPSMAVMLSGIFPGLGHFYLGETKTAAGLLGAAGAELGVLAASILEDQKEAAFFSLLAFSNTANYGIYAAYRDARRYNAQEGYKYRMPTDDLADLSAAPFLWNTLKKPEVWGGYLGALATAFCINYFLFPKEARIAPSSSLPNGKQFLFPAAALPVGIGEESFFRGFLQSWLSETLTPWGAIAASSLLFGASHIPNAFLLPEEYQWRYYSFSLPLITLMGAYFGWLTQKNASLKESVALHTWYDFSLFSLAAVAQSAAIGCPRFSWLISF